MTPKPTLEEHHDRRNDLFVAILLIAAGLLTLLLNFVEISENVALLIMPLLGVVFLAYGLFTHKFGFTVPGWILAGLGAGIYIGVEVPGIPDEATGGVIVLGLAIAFFGILLMNVMFDRRPMWWPVIPGGILGVVGVLLLIGTNESLNLLEILGRYWPVILIVIGVWMLVARRENRRES